MTHLNSISHCSKFISIFLFLILISSSSQGQNFVKMTDTTNPIVTDVFLGTYFGSSWIDIDNDNLLDLYVNSKAIYKNLGNGNFTKLESILGVQRPTLSNTWADYNNDGYIDGFLTSTGAPNSFLYKNNGNGTFTKITAGDIGDSAYNTGWGCAWGDYDNDGYTDLVIVAAYSFGSVFHPNRLYHNSGDGNFTRVDMPSLTDTLAPFTIPTWTDYDLDGDIWISSLEAVQEELSLPIFYTKVY